MNITKTQLMLITLGTAFVGSLAALYVGYQIGKGQLQQQAQSNPILNLLSNL